MVPGAGNDPAYPTCKIGANPSQLTWQKMVPGERLELSKLWILSPATLPICPSRHGTQGEIRTHNSSGLNRMTLPIGLPEHGVGTRIRTENSWLEARQFSHCSYTHIYIQY